MASFPTEDSMPPEQWQAFLQKSAQFPPNNTLPNLIDPPNRNDIALGVTTVCIVLTSVFALLRAYSKIVVNKKVKIEDVLGLLAFVAFGGIIWTSFRLQHLHMFWCHQWNIRIINFSEILFALYIWPCCYALLMGFVKPAILLEWNRTFVPRGVRNRFWWTCMALIMLNVLFYAASLVAVQFYCSPHERIWRRWIPGTCRERRSMDAPSAVFNLTLDVLILLLPQRVIWKLQMTRSKKIGISVIFGVGVLAVVCATGRVHGVLTLNYVDDVTYHVGKAYLWSMAECTCVMMVFCVPAVPKVFVDSWLSNKIATSLRSLTGGRFSTSSGPARSGSGSGSNSRWRTPTVGNARPSRGKTYTETIDDEASSQVHLAHLEPAARPAGRGYYSGEHRAGDGILRTTEISTEAYGGMDSYSKDWTKGQQPWENSHKPT